MRTQAIVKKGDHGEPGLLPPLPHHLVDRQVPIGEKGNLVSVKNLIQEIERQQISGFLQPKPPTRRQTSLPGPEVGI